MIFRSTSLQETHKIAHDFITNLLPSTHAVVVGLHGDLGSGKTTFTQAIAKTLGIEETVTSPTFVIEKIYKTKHQAFSHLIHIDAYRLERAQELQHLGWEEIIKNPENLIFIEWPEKVAEILPSDIKKLQFRFVDETTREIEVE
jgi:tRNA threonylcarbamoyladenosine biosynthesis protein TsaE